eukprot:COSAG05_NODE_20627_length_278_cov_0.575419_2_plen_23_part_01
MDAVEEAKKFSDKAIRRDDVTGI